MVSIFELFLIVLFILFIEVTVLKVDLSSPAFIFTASFFICSMTTCYVSKDWGIELIHLRTYNMIIFSLIIFLSIEEFVRFVFYKKYNKKFEFKQRSGNLKLKSIYIPFSVIKISIALNLIGVLWALMYIYNYLVTGNWIAMMANYKDAINADNYSVGYGKMMLNQLSKVIVAFNYILLFIYNNNKCVGVTMSSKVNRFYIISFVSYMLFRIFLTGGRQSALFFLVAWLTCNFICKICTENKSNIKKAEKNYFIVLASVVAIVFPLFHFLGRFVGRKDGMVFEAATSYLSTGFYGLDCIVGDGHLTRYWGMKSFPALFPLMKYFGVLPLNLEPQSFLDFFAHGNTVTLLGRYCWDFGEVGTFIMIAIFAIVFSYIYYSRIKYPISTHDRNMSIILYCYMIHVLYFAGYDDFAMNFISLSFLLTVLIIYFCYKYIVIKGRI